MRTNKTYKTFSVKKTNGFPGDRLILAVIETCGWEMNSGLNSQLDLCEQGNDLAERQWKTTDFSAKITHGRIIKCESRVSVAGQLQTLNVYGRNVATLRARWEGRLKLNICCTLEFTEGKGNARFKHRLLKTNRRRESIRCSHRNVWRQVSSFLDPKPRRKTQNRRMN